LDKNNYENISENGVKYMENKKERNPCNSINTDSPTLSFMHNGISITVSFSPSPEHTVSIEDLVDILFSSVDQV